MISLVAAWIHWGLDGMRWLAIFMGLIAIALWSGLLIANWSRIRAANGAGKSRKFERAVIFVSAGVIGLIAFGIGRLGELIYNDEPVRLVGGPTLLILYLLIDVGLVKALAHEYTYAIFRNRGAISKDAVFALKKVADQEHAALKSTDEGLQAQIDEIVKVLESRK